jgi:hypothetical protein
MMLASLACLAMGCTQHTLDLGADDGGANDANLSTSSALAGTWKGYIESFQFPSGSGTLTFAFTRHADGSLAGTVTFGDKALPPPTDPNVGYPPGATYTVLSDASIEGFAYTATQISFDGMRLRLGVSTRELWAAWCGLQTPYPVRNGFGCLPSGSDSFSPASGVCSYLDEQTGNWVVGDCAKIMLCTGTTICACSATSCTGVTVAPDVMFDMQLVGDPLDGSASTSTYDFSPNSSSTPPLDAHNIHLTRMP